MGCASDAIRGVRLSVFGYLAYPPVARGLIVLLLAGAAFPLTGIFVLRLNLITLRFTLMHGTLLGGAIALGFALNPLWASAAVNLFLIASISWLNRRLAVDTGHITTFFMVITIGVAFAVMYRTGVAAKDTLFILWGNLYAMNRVDFYLTLAFCSATILLVVAAFPKLVAILFDRSVAVTVGVNERLTYNVILLLIGFTIAFAMRLIGALLLDAVLLLPAILARLFARSIRGMFLIASVIGVLSSALGFFLSLIIDIPASSGVTIVAAAILGIGLIAKRGTK